MLRLYVEVGHGSLQVLSEARLCNVQTARSMSGPYFMEHQFAEQPEQNNRSFANLSVGDMTETIKGCN